MSKRSSEGDPKSLVDKVNEVFIRKLCDVKDIDSKTVDAIENLLKTGEKILVDTVLQSIEQEDLSDEDT